MVFADICGRAQAEAGGSSDRVRAGRRRGSGRLPRRRVGHGCRQGRGDGGGHGRRPGRLRDGRPAAAEAIDPQDLHPDDRRAPARSSPRPTSSPTALAGRSGSGVPRPSPTASILDPELTVSLPAALTAWTGLDAFVHALEASTNVRRHAWNDLYAHAALSLIAGALEKAVRDPTDLDARGRMLLGAAYAGIAIDNCSAAMAHNVSHALAALVTRAPRSRHGACPRSHPRLAGGSRRRGRSRRLPPRAAWSPDARALVPLVRANC